MHHVDRPSLVVSAILHIASDCMPWPLHIRNHTGEEHAVLLQPGEMLFYESARLSHGRPVPLVGSYYASVFAHFHPVGWALTSEDVNAYLPHDWDRETRQSHTEF